MEPSETKCGILIIFVGFWILVSGILGLIEKIVMVAPFVDVSVLLVILGVPSFLSIIGILGIIAGLLIYRTNKTGGKLAFSTGVLGVNLTIIQILLYAPYRFYYDPFNLFSLFAEIITACSAPMLLLVAGIQRFRAELGNLIIVLGIFYLVPHFIVWGLLMIQSFIITPMKILFLFSLFLGVLDIMAGRWTRNRLARGPELAVFMGILHILSATVFNLLVAYDPSYQFHDAALVFFYFQMIFNYRTASLVLVGALIARQSLKEK